MTNKKQNIDHDRLFKELLSTFFWEFLELFLPKVTEYVERNSIVFLSQEIFVDVTLLRSPGSRFGGENAISGPGQLFFNPYRNSIILPIEIQAADVSLLCPLGPDIQSAHLPSSGIFL